ncbi:ParM/StbA family protein [Acidithiobacillus ferrooxidans]|uniref:ParM/StbA family protein n=1 Tax=Acidithiobacillus ferrooxidans TaxID=920 RepID=UPI0013D47016|nr:ParM/StbA family protein [Acidithiobacillus ferrooxidans]
MKIVVDDGYGNIKVVFRGENGIEKHIVPALAVAGVYPVVSNSDDDRIQFIRTEGEVFTVGSPHDAEDTRFQHYATSNMNRALVRYAIQRAGVTDDAVFNLGVGLPAGQFFVGGKPNTTAIEAKTAHHKLQVFRVTDKNSLLSVPDHVACFPQSSGVALIHEDPDLDPDDIITVAVVDIGHRTTDVSVTIDGELRVSRSGGMMDHGVAHARNRFKDALEQRFGLNMARMVDRAFSKKNVMISGERFDVSAEWQESVDETAQTIIRAVEALVGGTADIDRILLIGGGALIFGDSIQKAWKQAKLVDDPVFANALSWLSMMDE